MFTIGHEVRGPNKARLAHMLNLTLQHSDSIASILPTLELAMRNGDVCRIHNVDVLGAIHLAALALLGRSDSLLDAVSGRIVHRRPGYCLQGIDANGVMRILAA